MTRRAPYPALTGAEPCRQHDEPDLWFSDQAADRATARRLCHGCPTRVACLAYALDHPAATEHGIWAGTSRGGREKLRAEFRRANQISKEQQT
ncbi:WhiB family transcriptional regulator [Streptomyces sp. MP131-18]|uniref:WhiB family transcriptional regulator n=1 Tax=Streptomyces sp. MP131-18 TaxID=1857892 RepID=UPI00097BEE73|nr:WhiB family transcriptional regulator [Streptomyces sp. MP131-18]ONK09284.1 Transcriptional regulator WhiB7 [Streptomyces sp. MP131-18]